MISNITHGTVQSFLYIKIKKTMKKLFIDGFNWWWYRFRVTKVWRIWTLLPLMFVSIWISGGQLNFWFILGCIFGLYPFGLFAVLMIYAWILNPIREMWPQSWFTQKIIKKIDSILR